jgi:hypothetical protein
MVDPDDLITVRPLSSGDDLRMLRPPLTKRVARTLLHTQVAESAGRLVALAGLQQLRGSPERVRLIVAVRDEFPARRTTHTATSRIGQTGCAKPKPEFYDAPPAPPLIIMPSFVSEEAIYRVLEHGIAMTEQLIDVRIIELLLSIDRTTPYRVAQRVGFEVVLPLLGRSPMLLLQLDLPQDKARYGRSGH